MPQALHRSRSLQKRCLSLQSDWPLDKHRSIERFHQTLKKWLAKRPRARSLKVLGAQIDEFCAYYNERRPHRAVGRRTPSQAFAARPKAAPTLDGSLVSPHFRVRHDKVDRVGLVTLRYNSRLHHIGVGRAHKGRRVLILAVDRRVRILTEEGELLRELTLDPSRDYQRQG